MDNAGIYRYEGGIPVNDPSDTKKKRLIPRLNREWCIPPEADADFVARMEDVLDVYTFVAPPEGWRRVEITERRTRKDWAARIKRLVDEYFPQAEKIAPVMDNLNTRGIASLYETFPAEEAKRLWDKKRNPLYSQAWELA